ncbi:MAG TPA: hypothetical protein PLO37_12620 [Candidatus Hydrogenedentes bacterium]|nr:hypothetical protein [Candidatus Hydrogenedentota bacterium]HPG67686.1 hypothetical protein [Candidatus Hydrogenedentota bacterium]
MQLEFEFPEADSLCTKADVQTAPQERPVFEARDSLPIERVERLRLELERHSKQAVRLTVTDNRSRMIVARPDSHRKIINLRLHHMFLTAPPEVVCALGHWIAHPRSSVAGETVDRFIREHQHCIRPAVRRPPQLRTQGHHFDLQAIFDELNASQFGNAVTASITWGSMPATRRTRRFSIRFGSYIEEDNLVRIHPLLDQDFVPSFFVRYIVFHEMLHAYVGFARTPGGRRRIHSPEFQRLERSFPDYGRSLAWQEANLGRLLRCRRAFAS